MWRRRRLAGLGLAVLAAVAITYGLRAGAPSPPSPPSTTPGVARLLARGAHWLEIGRPFRAVQAYLRAIRLSPDDADAWTGLAGIAISAGQADNARLAAARALASRPSDADAEALYQRAAALPPPPSVRPGRPHAVTRRRCAAAQHLFARRRVADAILALEAAAWLDERAARPQRDLANVYYLQGRVGEAIVAQRAAVARAPQSVPLRRNLAALEAQGAAAATPAARAD